MADKTNYFEQAIIDYFLRPGVAAPTRPTNLYIGLATASTDTEVPTVTECSYAGYARQLVTFVAATDNGAAKRTSNSALLSFPAIAGATVNVSHFLIGDATTAGNVYVVKVVTGGPIACLVGDTPQFAIGALTHDEA